MAHLHKSLLLIVAAFLGLGVLPPASESTAPLHSPHSYAARSPASTAFASSSAAKRTLESTSEAFHDAAQKAIPSVVTVTASRGEDPEAKPVSSGDSPFSSRSHGPGVGIGSGVVIREDGLILTSYHVVDQADEIQVQFDEKRPKLNARVLGADPKTDIALLELTPKMHGLPVIQLGNSDQVRVGDWAIAVGNPFGLSHSVTSGIISARGRGQMGQLSLIDSDDFLQTDTAINPGNSGGPLLNLNGEMIGLNAAIYSQTGGYMGIGFAIPSKLVKSISDQILTNGRVIRGWIGVAAQNLEGDLAKYFKTPEGKGALISEVRPGGPAAQALIQSGDVILKFDGKEVTDSTSLKNVVSQSKSGAQVPVSLLRGGQAQNILVTVQEMPQPKLQKTVQRAGHVAGSNKDHRKGLGLAVEDIPPELKKFMEIPNQNGAIVTEVRPGSPAYEAGLAPGDVILRAGDRAITNAKDFQSFSRRLGKDELSVLYVQRGPEERVYLPLRG